MKRLFVAIPFPPDDSFTLALGSLEQSLAHEHINWVKPQQIHFTLKFLGETPESDIARISDCLLRESPKFKCFSVNTGQLGVFGSSYKPRVLFVNFENPESLIHLGQHFLSAFADIGFPADRQNFVPHLTLGRIKKLSDKHGFQALIDNHRLEFRQAFSINSIILYESILTPEGPIYVELLKTQLAP